MLANTLRLSALAGAVCLALSAPALAVPINPVNTRPVTVNNPATSGTDLQTVLTDLFGASAPDVVTGQDPAGMWSSATGSPASQIPTLEYSNGNPADSFGIWFGTYTSNLLLVPLINAGAPQYTAAGISNLMPGSITVFGATCGAAGVNCGTFTDPLITPFSFGYYVNNGTDTFYTVDQLNGGTAQALAYHDPNTTNWAIGFRDGVNNPPDYNNYVVKIESVEPVPEPGTLALFGTSLFGLAGILRRRRKLVRGA